MKTPVLNREPERLSSSKLESKYLQRPKRKGQNTVDDINPALLGGSWDLVSKDISTLIGVISRVTIIITLVTKSHETASQLLI